MSIGVVNPVGPNPMNPDPLPDPDKLSGAPLPRGPGVNPLHPKVVGRLPPGCPLVREALVEGEPLSFGKLKAEG